MRTLVNINPELNSEVLDKCRLKFDGYYYTNDVVPFQLAKNTEDAGYTPYFKDPGLPPMKVNLTAYSDLIAFMHAALQFVIPARIQEKKLEPTEQAISKFAKEWWDFDKDLKFILISNEQGLAVMPNDEYTFSLVNGSIKECRVLYKNLAGDMTPKSLLFECTLQCISWPFLCHYIAQEDEEIDDNKRVEVESIVFKDNDNWIPFFGMGIPKATMKR
jgi:hypothetical protein